MKNLKNTLFYILLLFAFNTVDAQKSSKNFINGVDAFEKKNYKKALKYFRKEYKKNQSNSVRYAIGNTCAQLDDYGRAKEMFLAIIKSRIDCPEREPALGNIALCYIRLESNDSAFYYFDKAIYEFPDNADTYFNKGQLLKSLSNLEEAKKYFDLALERDSSNWFYFHKRLETCFGLKNYDCALRDLLKAKKLNPDLDINGNLAYCYTNLKRYHEADSVFTLIYNDNDAIFLNNYGYNKFLLGNTTEGRDYILKSLSIDPGNAYAYRNLAMIEFGDNNKVKMCEYLNKAKSLNFEKFYGKEVNQMLLLYCK